VIAALTDRDPRSEQNPEIDRRQTCEPDVDDPARSGLPTPPHVAADSASNTMSV
jgi:hypothetical protein